MKKYAISKKFFKCNQTTKKSIQTIYNYYIISSTKPINPISPLNP